MLMCVEMTVTNSNARQHAVHIMTTTRTASGCCSFDRTHTRICLYHHVFNTVMSAWPAAQAAVAACRWCLAAALTGRSWTSFGLQVRQWMRRCGMHRWHAVQQRFREPRWDSVLPSLLHMRAPPTLCVSTAPTPMPCTCGVPGRIDVSSTPDAAAGDGALFAERGPGWAASSPSIGLSCDIASTTATHTHPHTHTHTRSRTKPSEGLMSDGNTEQCCVRTDACEDVATGRTTHTAVRQAPTPAPTALAQTYNKKNPNSTMNNTK